RLRRARRRTERRGNDGDGTGTGAERPRRSRQDRRRTGAMTSIQAPVFERSEQDRVIAGVCGGLASTLGVDATLVRLAFALFALAGGAGILLYLALWRLAEHKPQRGVVALGVAALLALLVALGLSGAGLIGTALLVAGGAFAVSRGGSLRPGGSLPIPAVALAMIGAVILLDHLGTSGSFVAPGALV